MPVPVARSGSKANAFFVKNHQDCATAVSRRCPSVLGGVAECPRYGCGILPALNCTLARATTCRGASATSVLLGDASVKFAHGLFYGVIFQFLCFHDL